MAQKFVALAAAAIIMTASQVAAQAGYNTQFSLCYNPQTTNGTNYGTQFGLGRTSYVELFSCKNVTNPKRLGFIYSNCAPEPVIVSWPRPWSTPLSRCVDRFEVQDQVKLNITSALVIDYMFNPASGQWIDFPQKQSCLGTTGYFDKWNCGPVVDTLLPPQNRPLAGFTNQMTFYPLYGWGYSPIGYSWNLLN